MSRPKIVVLGLCAKKDPHGGVFPPLGPRSRSGKFIRSAVETAAPRSREIVFDNIIAGCVIDAAGQERNPKAAELLPSLKRHWSLKDETVKVVVALGGEARKAFEALPANLTSGIRVCFLPHPSYVMRRPLAERDAYLKELRGVLVA